MISNTLDRISFWSLFLVIVLLPFFFLPFVKVPVETSKGLLLVIGLVISIIFWTAARFSGGKITLPKSWLLVSGFGIVLSFFLSALFSKASGMSFFGIMFDVGTFWFMFGAFLLMLVSSMVLRDSRRAKMVLLGLLASFAIIFLFQTLRLFAPQTFSLGVLGQKTDNIFGSWNALGLFAGLSLIISLFLTEFFSIPKRLKWMLGVLMLFSVLLAMIVNFSLVWELLGIFSLIIFVYKVSFYSSGKNVEERNKHFPSFSLAVVMISLLFFMAGQFIGSFLPNHLGVSNIEISPSLSTTLQVTKTALAKNPILGIGPNRFAEVWAMYKPLSINSTQFWDTSFSSGSGVLPTFASATGYVGVLAWLAFFVLFMMSGIKSLFSSARRSMSQEATVFFVAALYLFVSTFFYSTGPVIILLAFASTGIFIGLTSNHKDGEVTLSFLDDPRKSFFSILFLVFIMIITAALGFKYVERFASIFYFEKTISADTIPKAEASISKALSLYSNDLYFRTYAQVYLVKLSDIVAKGSNITEEDKATLQPSLDQAINGAQSAVTYNPANYLNLKTLGSVYETVSSFGVATAYDKAIEAYTRASTFNPLNPGIQYALAHIAFANGKTKEADNYAHAALTLKPDYIDALILLSQIAKGEGDTAGALSYAEQALAFLPTNTQLIQYVNTLKNSNNTPVVNPIDNSKSNSSTTDSKKTSN